MKLRIVALMCALIAIPVLAYAHALLISSSPRDNAALRSAPKQVVLRFDARVEKGLSKARLYDSSGKEIRLSGGSNGYKGGSPEKLIIPMPKLKPGSYRLEYRVFATDGHLTPGLVRFTILGRKPR